jgi:Sulfotransferase domain
MTLNGRVKVLYIAGFGRSGSTILASILGQIGGFFSTGELRYVWKFNVLDNTICGCGTPFRECNLWNSVFDDAFGGMDGVDAHEMVRLQNLSTRTRHIPLVLMPWGRRLLASRLQNYSENLGKLYQAIQARTGSRVIVDSSKLPMYGFVLDTIPSIDLYVVHLIRDPRGVSYSWQKKRLLPPLPGKEDPIYQYNYSPISRSILWAITNVAVEMFWRRRSKRYLKLRYEDLVDRPRESLRRILELVHEQESDPLLPLVAERTLDLEVNHTTSGNPSRFRAGTVELRRDTEWESRMKLKYKAVTTLLTWPFLLRYRYPVARIQSVYRTLKKARNPTQ